MRIMILPLVAALVSSSALASTTQRRPFGRLPDGAQVEAITLQNGHGMSATVISYGATIQSVLLPDAQGGHQDVVLGFPTLQGYLGKREFFGGTVGRYANRIAKGRFPLDGRTVELRTNDRQNALHGGPEGFDRVLWEIVSIGSTGTASVTFRRRSPDGDQGYPGAVVVDATFSLDEADGLHIEYRATTDRPTIVNVSNHAYWNLSGEGSAGGAMGHLLTIPAAFYLPTDETAIPTGDVRPVAGTPFDFTMPRPVGERVRDASDGQIAIGRGYDHNWVVTRKVTNDEHLMARVFDPASGHGFELWSNQPGLQFYSGNFLDGTTSGKSVRFYRAGDALVLEPQLFPDTPNEPAFGSAVLRPGETYLNKMTYRFTFGQTGG